MACQPTVVRLAHSGCVIDVTGDWQSLALGAGEALAGVEALRPVGLTEDAWMLLAADVARPLAALIRTLGPHVVGLSGPPGSGKTTLARAVVATLGPRAMQVSMDDFYLSRADREAKGLRFRGAPGSHDLAALVEVLDHVRAQSSAITIPRYDTHADDRGEPETIDHAPRPLILDGYFLGYDGDGYDAVVERLDVLVFLDMDVGTAKRRRFGREQALRDEGGGLSDADMRAFWDDVLGPGVEHLVPVARSNADLVLTFGLDDRVHSVGVRREREDVLAAISTDRTR
jgi:pantothenate kinase-related protein Tda10